MPAPLARRYFFKLLANVVAVPVYLVMEAILPRALGPQVYGNYNFAINLFQQLAGFLDMGTSTCFYNALSRRQHETPLLSFYLRIVLLVFAALCVAALILLFPDPGHLIMPDMPLILAPLAALWAFLTWLGRVLRSTNDALGATIPGELARAAISICALFLLIGLYITDCLNLHTLFLQQYILLGGICIASFLVSKNHWHCQNCNLEWHLPTKSRSAYFREFFDYSHPLLIQALLSFLMLSAERWLLQWFDGSAQQGFYALSQKVSMACFLFVSAMTPLLMREFSVAWGKGDTDAMGRLLSRFAPALYAVAAYFSCFTMAEGKTVVEIFGGTEFAAATLAVQIMALYPLHQAYGQMAGSVFHASGKTHIIRNMTACECIYGLATAWFLLAPPSLWGLNLGATGLAIKTVAVQFISVNIYLWLASRMVPFDFYANLLHQMVIVVVFTLLAIASQGMVEATGLFLTRPVPRILMSGSLYTLLVCAVSLWNPRLLGMSRQELKDLYGRIKNRPRNKQ